MKAFFLKTAVVLLAGAAVAACDGDREAPVAVFSDFSYSVTLPDGDEVASPDWAPLLPGCYPDPSVVRVGDDY